MLEWIQDYLPFILQIIVLINNNRRQNYSLNKQEINTVRESLNIWNAQPQYVPVHSIASLKHLIRGVFPLLPLCPVVSTRLWCFFSTVFLWPTQTQKRFILSLLQNIWVSSLAAKHWICWACYLGCLRNVASQVFLILCVTCLKLFSSGLLFATYCNIVSVCMVIQGIHHQWTHVLNLFLK